MADSDISTVEGPDSEERARILDRSVGASQSTDIPTQAKTNRRASSASSRILEDLRTCASGGSIGRRRGRCGSKVAGIRTARCEGGRGLRVLSL